MIEKALIPVATSVSSNSFPSSRKKVSVLKVPKVNLTASPFIFFDIDVYISLL